MKYSDFIVVNEKFQSSVNLQYDLNNEDKLNSYIPTKQSISVLQRYLNAIYNDSFNEDNATVLIGPYGRGKSHLLLVLSALMGYDKKIVSSETMSNLLKKLYKADNTTGKLAQMLIDKKKPMLPIIINSNHIDINQSFILAMREALERTKMNDLSPETYFDSAIKMIETWENNFENAYKTLKKELKSKKIKVDDLKERLHKCDTDAYRMFCDVYPTISNGAEFIPFQNTDVVKMYEQVATALIEQKGYSGIYIVFDEFSKFLESTAVSLNMQNFKLIQDFAEIAVRSSKMHICCITHKEILDYSQSDNFRTVDGRFKKVSFVASSEQSYELVANAVIHKEGFNDFFANHKSDFDIVSQCCHRIGVFHELSDGVYNDLLIKKCFPLHPLSTYALIHISEVVGQNERTLFTFLSQNENFSLQSFLNKRRKEDKISFLTIDWIFDYFSDLFRVEIFNPRIHSIWAKTKAAIKKCESDIQKTIVKTLAIFKMIKSDYLIATGTNLKYACNMSDVDFDNAINFLEKNNILTRTRNDIYEFLTPNGVDIKKNINNLIEQGSVTIDRPIILKEAYSTPFILPRQHNSKNRIMRYFATTFMEAKDFWNYTGNFTELMHSADGLLIFIIADSYQETEHIEIKLQELGLDKNIIVCVSEEWKYDRLLLEYQATCWLESQDTTNDTHFKEELQVYKYDLFKTIKETADNIYSPVNPKAAYYTSTNLLEDVIKPLFLNRELSSICDTVYSKTPIINNEMVNKNKLTSQIKKARIKMIDWILEHNDDIAMIEGYGPEVSLLRSTITVKGLDLGSVSSDKNLNEVLNYISESFSNSENTTTSFEKLYSVLQSAPYGMRKGVIPIYLAYIIRKMLDNIVISYKNKEVDICGDILSKIEDATNDYSFYIEKGTKEKEEYLKSVIELFSQEQEVSVSNQCAYAVASIQRWFRGLSKFSRDHIKVYNAEGISDVNKKIITLRRQILQYDINSHAFLYKDMPALLDSKDDYSGVINALKTFVENQNCFIDDTKRYIVNEVIKMFNVNIRGSLTSVMSDWYNQLSDNKKNHVYSTDVNIILHFISENTRHDDIEVVSQLAKSVTMLSIEDWNDNCLSDFLQSIHDFVDTVNKYEEVNNADEDKDDGYVEISLNYSGTVFEKNIDNTKIEGIAETAMNNIESQLEDYADSISAQERISILLKLLRNEIEKL